MTGERERAEIIGKSGCANCAGCPLAGACRSGKLVAKRRCEPSWWPVYIFYTLLAFCVIRYGVTALSESMHLRPDYDANIYHIIGRGWMEGVLPYVGLSDLKGPLVFLYCGLGSILTPNSFLGVSLIHACVIGLGMLYACKGAAIFVGRLTAMAITGVLFVYTIYFSVHPSVIVLSLQYISLYYVLQQMVQGGRFGCRVQYGMGAIVGVVLLLKFNLIAFWLPIGVYIMVVAGRRWWAALLYMAAGCASVVLPMLIYMGSVGMVYACWKDYVLAAAEYGSVGIGASAMAQCGWRLLAQVVPDHLYLYGPEWLNAMIGMLVLLPWIFLPYWGRQLHSRSYWGVLGSGFLLSLVAIFGGKYHFLHYYFSFLPYMMLSGVAWVLLMRRWGIMLRVRRRVCWGGVLWPLVVVAAAVMLPQYVDACKPEKGLKESRHATAALANKLRGRSFLCTEANTCLHLYRLSGGLPPICHFVPQMTSAGYRQHRAEMLRRLKNTPPQYLVCTLQGAADTEQLIAKSGVPYRRLELLPPDFPAYPATADYAPFCLYERVR